jgi:Asp-tRNA(Asn)/Glu-tRNA(Gln) amidotransferase A subunit family amidase
VALSQGKAPLSEKLSLRRLFKQSEQFQGPLAWNRYLARRGDERVKDWASWVANAKWDSDTQRAAAINAVSVQDARIAPDTISHVKMQTALRMIVLKVMYENGIDAFVNPENTLPPFKLGGASEPTVDHRDANGYGQGFTPMMGAPEIEVPAGYVTHSYDPTYVLSPDKKRYVPVTGAVKTQLPQPMPISLAFWAGPGDEPAVIKVSSAYEAATQHRVPPPKFGPPRARRQ